VIDAHSGLLAQTRGPGSIRGLTVTNFLVSKALFNAPCKPWMGNGNPIAISADRWCSGPAPCDNVRSRCVALRCTRTGKLSHTVIHSF
jgi:hypothetical protein